MRQPVDEPDDERANVGAAPIPPIEGLTLTSIFEDDGPFESCYAAMREAPDILTELEQGSLQWELTDRPEPEPASGGAGTVSLAVFAPSPPLGEASPEVEAVRASCGWVLPALRQLAEARGECAPIRPNRPPLWEAHMQGGELAIRAIYLAKAAIIMARAHDDAEAALHQLIDLVVVMRDIRQGPTSLVMAMISAAAEQMAWAGFQSELVAEPQGIDFDSIRDRMDQLLAGPSILDERAALRLLSTDAFGIYDKPSGWADPVLGREIHASALRVAEELESRCATRTPECIEGLRPTGTRPDRPQGLLFDLLGPRAFANATLAYNAAMALDSYNRYLFRLLALNPTVHTAKQLITLVEARSESVCVCVCVCVSKRTSGAWRAATHDFGARTQSPLRSRAT